MKFWSKIIKHYNAKIMRNKIRRKKKKKNYEVVYSD